MMNKTLWLVCLLVFLCLCIFGSTVAEEQILFAPIGGVRFFQENEKIGLMDEQGKILYPSELDRVVPFLRHGLCLVRKGDEVAMMDKSGNIVIPFTQAFTIATATMQTERKLGVWFIATGEKQEVTVSESVVVMKEENGGYYCQYYLVDGTPIASGYWKGTYPFIQGSAFVQDIEDEQWYLIDTQGNRLTDVGLYWPDPDFSAGGGKGWQDGKTYVIDAKGTTRAIYVKEETENLKENLYKEDVLEAFYDESGQRIDKPWKRIATYDGRQMAQGEVWGFVDDEWNMVEETNLTELRLFEDPHLAPPSLAIGIACLRGEDTWRLVDGEFNVLSANEWERLAYIGQNRFLGQKTVKKKWESSILNEQGDILFTFPLGYTVRAFVDEGYILYETDTENQKGYWGFYDYEGNETCKIKKSQYSLMPGEIPDVYPKLKDGVMVVFEKGNQNTIVHAETGNIYADNHDWDEISDYSFGRAFARKGTDWYLIDDTGVALTTYRNRYANMQPFGKYGDIVLARGTYAENGRTVYFDTQGREVAGESDPVVDGY